MIIDSHCHLHFPQLRDDIPALLVNMQAAEVTKAICVCTALDEIPLLCKLLDTHPQLYASVGVHPTAPASARASHTQLLEVLASHRKFVAVGESGLDYFHTTNPQVHAHQVENFAIHIAVALSARLPLIVHTRNAKDPHVSPTCIDTTLDLLEPHCRNGLRAVLHCYTGTWQQAQRALNAGCWLSFTGIVTFKNAKNLLAIATHMPLDRLMVETDAPYLAPVPYRGQRNEPAFIRHVAECIATARDMDLQDFVAATTATTEAFYGLEHF